MSAVVELTLRSEQGQPHQWRIPVASEQAAGKVVAQIMLLLAVEPDGSQNQKANKTRRVYEALTALADQAGWCRSYQVEIATQAGISARHLRRLIAELETLGLVRVKRARFGPDHKTRNAYFLPLLSAAEPGEDKILSAMMPDSLSAMNHDDDGPLPNKKIEPQDKNQYLRFIHEGERQARLAQSHGTPTYLQTWDDWWAAGQFGRLRNPAGWANTQIKKGYWPPPLAPSLLSSSDLISLSSGQQDDETAKQVSQEDELWAQILSHLQLQLSRATFEAWLKDTQLTARNGSKFTVAVKNAFGRDWLEHRLRIPIRRVIAPLIGVEPEQVELLFVVK